MLSAKKISKVFALAAVLALPAVMGATGCAGGSDGDVAEEEDDGGGSSGAGATDDPGPTEGICLLNNCSEDAHCAGCADNRDTCLVAENRCVACDPNTGMGCPEGEACSPFGICAPAGQTCPTDAEGVPTISCTQNADCLACSPMNQVCDTAIGACVACTSSNTQHCLQSDICIEGECSPKCPDSCSTDADCGQCGGPGNEAHACNAHKCAECSDTWPCPAGLSCSGGSCIPGCGIPGPTSGDCLSDEDCKFCGDGTGSGSWDCKKPINANGPNDHGTCGPAAAGCSDLGQSVAVLPEPFDQVTNACSNDGDCQGVGIQFNVGELIRDTIGNDKINLGFTEITINDANVNYNMPVCAEVEITDDISCGICVPCETDADCAPIAVDPLISQLFANDPLAMMAGALLIDLLYGDNEDHSLHFQCQPVAAGYGVCAPCSNPAQACGSGSSGGGGNTTGTCDHSVCDTGAALGSNCDSCAAAVCAQDPYCCNNQWDSICVGHVPTYCAAGTCGGGGGGSSTCVHSECNTGAALSPTCSSCAQAVCNADAYCCNNQWDSICVGKVDQYCGAGTCSGSGSGSSGSGGSGGGGSYTCAHGECETGAALSATCSSCAGTVCAQDSYCCDSQWDQICVNLADQHCGGCGI